MSADETGVSRPNMTSGVLPAFGGLLTATVTPRDVAFPSLTYLSLYSLVSGQLSADDPGGSGRGSLSDGRATWESAETSGRDERPTLTRRDGASEVSLADLLDPSEGEDRELDPSRRSLSDSERTSRAGSDRRGVEDLDGVGTPERRAGSQTDLPPFEPSSESYASVGKREVEEPTREIGSSGEIPSGERSARPDASTGPPQSVRPRSGARSEAPVERPAMTLRQAAPHGGDRDHSSETHRHTGADRDAPAGDHDDRRRASAETSAGTRPRVTPPGDDEPRPGPSRGQGPPRTPDDGSSTGTDGLGALAKILDTDPGADRFVDRVYEEMRRKKRTERERRGL